VTDTASQHVREKGGGLLLPGAPRTAVKHYAARRSSPVVSTLSLAPSFMARYDGTIPDESITFTTYVDPSSAPNRRPTTGQTKTGGAAGYRPRVRNAYSALCLSS